jgi:maleate isomerase
MKLPSVDPTSATRIGVVSPFDLELDRELWQWVDGSVSLHITRTRFEGGPVDLELAAAVADEEEITRATRSLVAARPGVVVYLCTSGSFVAGLAGERRLRDVMTVAGAPQAITTSGALIDALAALGARRVAVAAPYTEEVGERLLAFLRAAGHEPVSLVSLGLGGDIPSVSADRVIKMAIESDRPDADAVFLSCTNLRTFDVLTEIEARLGKPVITANQVTMWSALRIIRAPAAEGVRDQALFRASPTIAGLAAHRLDPVS